jgi:plasmid stabilization system protein ParE
MAVSWRARALSDVSAIVLQIAQDNPVAAGQVAGKIMRAADRLKTFPHRGRPGRLAGTRELTVVYPYLIVYRVSAEGDVTILRVWHGARDLPSGCTATPADEAGESDVQA